MDEDWETLADDLSAFKLDGAEPEEQPEKDEFEGGWEATESWDTSKDAVPAPQPKNEAKSGVPAPKILTKAQKKKQKQEALLRKKEEEERRAQVSVEELRKQKEEDLKHSKMSDYENALDLFGGAGEPPKAESVAAPKKDPESTAEFVEFATSISNDVKKFAGNAEYLNCVKEITRQTCDVEDLTVEDVRAVVQTLNTLINKKLKEEKGRKGKGKGAKAGAKVNVRGASGGDFEDHKAGEFDDFLDFM